jgi:hypothetical protein
MHTRLTQEGRIVRDVVLRFLQKVVFVGLCIGGVVVAGREILPAAASWWRSVQTPSPLPQVAAPTPSATHQPQMFYIPHITSVSIGSQPGSVPSVSWSQVNPPK